MISLERVTRDTRVYFQEGLKISTLGGARLRLLTRLYAIIDNQLQLFRPILQSRREREIPDRKTFDDFSATSILHQGRAVFPHHVRCDQERTRATRTKNPRSKSFEENERFDRSRFLTRDSRINQSSAKFSFDSNRFHREIPCHDFVD